MERYFKRLSFIKYSGLLVLSVVLSVVVTLIILSFSPGGEPDAYETAMITLVSSGVMYGAMLLFIWLMSLNRKERYLILKTAPSRNRRNIWFALAALLWSLPVNFLYSTFLDRFFPEFLERMMEAGNLPENLFTTSDPMNLLMMFIPVVILAPIVEELIFRGVLYNLLNKRLSLPLAAVLSSLVFGLLHGATFFQTAVIGLVLTFVYQVTGDIRMAMAGHAINNGVAFLQGVLMQEGLLEEGSGGEIIYAVILLAGALIIVILTIGYFRKHSIRSIFKDRSPMYKHDIAKGQEHMDDGLTPDEGYSGSGGWRSYRD